MEQYIIKGGLPLVGEVEIGGAKNAALAIIAAAIMTDETVVIDNLPDVRDINVLLEAMQEIGAEVDRVDRHTAKINGGKISARDVDSEFIKKIRFEGYKYNPQENKNSFLHNIYYNYISYSMKYGFKSTNINNFIITFHFDDARRSIKSLNNIYDIVFLDAFSSQKDPTIWTIDFLSAVKDKMNKNSILVSYSKSTPFRSALLELGFSVGKTFINEIDMGTVASLNCENIKSKLSPYDIELLSTRSGITYKDSNLNLSAKEILNNREIEQKNSNRLSHTAFLKLYSK